MNGQYFNGEIWLVDRSAEIDKLKKDFPKQLYEIDLLLKYKLFIVERDFSDFVVV